jgi:hypothetical protein
LMGIVPSAAKAGYSEHLCTAERPYPSRLA